VRSEQDVLVLEDAAFPDSMTATWDASKIANVLSTAFSTAMKAGSSKKQTVRGRGQGEGPSATIDVLITFDRKGISSHPNHISLYHGAVMWLREMMKGQSGWECPVTLYTLTSTNIARKYISFLDAPLTMLQCVLDSMARAGKRDGSSLPRRLMYFSDVAAYRKAQQAMTTAHKSQMRWFRWGWISIGRYMVVNDLQRIKIN
jgi:N-acetylglucosaminylphosphatidylinositol deacetylase